MRRLVPAFVIAISLAACGPAPGERDVTVRLEVDDVVAHGSGVIQVDPATGVSTMVADIALDGGKSATLILGETNSVPLYEERLGSQILFTATRIPAQVTGSIAYARVGDRVVFSFDASDRSRTVFVDGSVTVTAIHGGAPPPSAAPPVQDDPYYDDYEDDSVAFGCESSPEPEPDYEPEPEYEYEDEASGGGCGGVEGDTYDDGSTDDYGGYDDMDSSYSDDGYMDDWGSDDDDSSAGCEGDTYDDDVMAKHRRQRRAIRHAWFFLWPVLLVGLFNRGLRRR